MAYQLPTLTYQYDALEPHIDARTMEIHHTLHHNTYVNNINAALAGTEYETQKIETILLNFASVPDQLKPVVRDHGGGHANHSLFWQIMSPQGGGIPMDDIAIAIDKELGGFSSFKEAFTAAALKRFGSGWAWLSVTPQKTLVVESSLNQDSPLMHGNTPILALDVWEHAYYLQYQNRRPEYINAFYNVIDWQEVNRRYQDAIAA
ncbi:superoxide dismutase, Fe-Mn family [Pseudoalteromonas ulvae UL12]|uniref:Superoxide dismutase n=1 Tax=Pseudoalteromonas ulvae TaxID=107327 RepID=A0A244CQP8_PSEDV|nr:superoxide dismutase [Pseudoalteromonas ulvae]MBE0365578.1 superoxide dismutase, Fe-Mn family [Pseudoalteromonas ulvae UL12]OUL57947.1 superoxide dismutase [Pseudoalteromonas ulvae]